MHSTDTGTVVSSDHFAIIADPSGEMAIYMPRMPEDGPLPVIWVALTAVMIRLQREEAFLAEMIDWFDEQTPEDHH